MGHKELYRPPWYLDLRFLLRPGLERGLHCTWCGAQPGQVEDAEGVAVLETGRRMCDVASAVGGGRREEGGGKVGGEEDEGSRAIPSKPRACRRMCV